MGLGWFCCVALATPLPTIPIAAALLVVDVDGVGAVRFGFPLPFEAVARGLRAEGGGAVLQWRFLQPTPDPVTGRIWVEVCLAPARGRIALHAGGVAAVAGDDGPVRTRERIVEESDSVTRTTTIDRYRDGGVDRVERLLFKAARTHDGEAFGAGEAVTLGGRDADQRWLRVGIAAQAYARAGVLPAAGARYAAYRDVLARFGAGLPTLSGRRGHGDYARSGGTITNLEFDTTLAFARLGMATRSRELLQRAADAARHLVDVDLDPRTALPFRHGGDHRTARPEPGHVWSTGLLTVGALAAQAEWIDAARAMARGLARHPALASAEGERGDDRLRDVAWPLAELEAFLRFEDDGHVRSAADRLADVLRRRFDATACVFRFGEGETRGAAYRERLWLTSGLALPALRAHLRRSPDAVLADQVSRIETRVLAEILAGREGLPLSLLVVDGRVVDAQRSRGRPEGYLLLEGLRPDAVDRALLRPTVRRALELDAADPDAATSFSIAGRCAWVCR